jgi:glutamate formiminotransferase/glutamate formiminotransferase/formiminotetrahydrofolate cyclodeaminase
VNDSSSAGEGRLPLVAVPNYSEGRSERVIGTLEATLGGRARVLNRHFDTEHNRCVFTIAAKPTRLVEALLAGAREALNVIDLRHYRGLHPHIGALDVCPVVWQAEDRHEDARRAAREVAKGIADLGIPVFFYGELATAPERTERAYFREGGPPELARRMKAGELEPDLGPSEPHPTAGATLVTARRPLVAFNVELDTADPEIAKAVAADLREAGGGLAGVRALGLPRENGQCQVSMNVQDPIDVPLAQVIAEIKRLAAEHGARPIEAELVGLAPEAAIANYPDDVPIKDFDPRRDIIENVLG